MKLYWYVLKLVWASSEWECLKIPEQRHLADTQMRLEDNSNVQRQLNEAASHAEMDLRSKQMQQNIEVS